MHGVARGWLTEKPIAIRDYLPSGVASPTLPRGVVVDIIIPVYRGLAQTRRCITSVLADTDRPPGRVIVVDDRSPDAKLSAWLDRLASEGRIQLVRNRRNLGFVASVNIGIEAAGTDDVVLLNSDTEVASGWLARLGGACLRGAARRIRVALLQQRDDLRLSRHRREPAGVRAWRGLSG